jgi:hypothetical protein
MPTRRRERNQQLFRAVNERIHEAGADFDIGAPHEFDFVCECGEAGCTEMLRIRLSEYEQIPRTGPHFIVKPGHERDGQTVLLRTVEYVLVEDTAAVETLPG